MDLPRKVFLGLLTHRTRGDSNEPRARVVRCSRSEKEFEDLFRSVRLVQGALEGAHGAEAAGPTQDPIALVTR